MLPVVLRAEPGRGTPLQLTRGAVVPIANVEQLKAGVEAANQSKAATTLLLKNGTYLLDSLSLEIACPGLVIRSHSGDRDAVIVRGPDEGPKAALGNVFLVSASNVVIADITLGYCRYHGIQARGESPYDVSGLLVHNCRLVNCNEQFIKGSSSDNDPVGATDGCIEQCLFEFTSGWAYQYYTGGIDIHKGVNWVVRDNEFRNLRVPAGQTGIAEHAVHFWKRCPTRPQNIVVERNRIVNCDRGIGFGLVNAEGGHWGGGSVIRDNVVFNDGKGPHTDVGIGLEWASDVQVENNTVVVQNYWAPMEYRFAGSTNLLFRNNLANAPIQRRDGAPPARLDCNQERTEDGVLIERNGRHLAVYGSPSNRPEVPDMVLLAEARRDVTWAARDLAQRGVKVVAPQKESEWLANPESFWRECKERRFHDYSQQSTRLPVGSIPISRGVKEGDRVVWEDLAIRVLETPGYTRGAVSYLMEVNGKKLAFTGDLIRDDGKLQDLFSLQDAIPDAKVGGYHGWAGRLGDLMNSLDRIAAEKPDLLIPLRGPVIADPLAAIDRLQRRIRAVYANYLSIDALRWYFKDDHILAKARRVLGPDSKVEWMDMAETLPLPKEIIAISNSRLLLSSDGSGFLVDCGGTGILEELRKLKAAGRLTTVEHVFVTHYHDDHTDALPALVQEYGAKVHACGSLIDVVERPSDYRLPCLTKNPSVVSARHKDQDSWKWKEYTLTILDFPGQTLHHNALLVQQEGGWSACFAGDSFTPSGIDDYCLQNRNILREGEGFLRCLDRLERLPPGCLILNQHVEPAFRFTSAQVNRMRETLRQRIRLLAELFPFDDPNYGLDEGWLGLHPYWSTPRPGESVEMELRITNHSPRERTFKMALRAPAGFPIPPGMSVTVPAHAHGGLRFVVQVPPNAPSGVHVLTASVAWEDGELREWTEAVLEVNP